MDTDIISTLLHTICDERLSPYTPIRVISHHTILYTRPGTANLILPNILRSKIIALALACARARIRVLIHAAQSYAASTKPFHCTMRSVRLSVPLFELRTIKGGSQGITSLLMTPEARAKRD
jgi:hypothetical protein